MGAILVLLLWVLCVAKCMEVWTKKGGSLWVGFWLGLVLGLLGLFIVHACQPSRNR